MNKSVIILGDPHIGASTSIGKVMAGHCLNSRVIDQLKLFDWVLDVAKREAVGEIIITGDVFEDPKPEPHLIALLLNWLVRCKRNNINVHIIMGNHDFVRIGGQYQSSLDVVIESDMENVSVYKNIDTVIIGDAAYTLIPYRDRKSMSCSSNKDAADILRQSIKRELASIPSDLKKVIVGHLAITGSIPVGNEIDDITNELFFDIADFAGYDYVWMGHVHKPQIMNKSTPFVAHIGSMDVSNFGETLQKKHIVLFDLALEGDFEKITLPTRDLKKVTITIPAGTQDTTQYVIDQIKSTKKQTNSIVKIELILDDADLRSVNKNKLESVMLKHGAYSVANISESKKTSIISKDDSLAIDNKMDVTAAIVMFSDSQIDKSKQAGFKSLAKELFVEIKGEL